MNLGQFTEASLLVPQLLAEWRDSVLFELSHRLEGAQRIENAIAFTHAVLDHESLASSVVDNVAFPLARGPDVKELSFALGLSRQGVRWGTGRTPAVQTVVLFAVPLTEEQSYFSLVLTILSFLKDETAFSALRRCPQPEDMLAVLNQICCVRTGPGATQARR